MRGAISIMNENAGGLETGTHTADEQSWRFAVDKRSIRRVGRARLRLTEEIFPSC